MVLTVATQSRQKSGHAVAVISIGLAKSTNQFFFFGCDHGSASDHCEGDERPADGEAAAQAPCQHLAEMGEVDGMTHAGANAAGDQTLVAVAGKYFRQTSELCEGKANSGKPIQREPGGEEEGGGNPHPVVFVKRDGAPWSREAGDGDPQGDPEGKKNFIRRVSARAPVLGPRVDDKPEGGDGGVEDAEQPCDSG